MINKILKKVKQNKKYKSINNNLIIKEIEKYFKKNPKTENEKKIIKNIRAELHKIYASFQTKHKRKLHLYLDYLKKIISKKPINKKQLIKITNKFLVTTISTKEHLNNYEKIYQNIFKITGKPNSITDIGSGLNLFSYPYMNLNKLNYYAYDINEEDIKFLNKYFEIMKKKGLSGKAKIFDITNEKIENIASAQIIFLFKVIDLIDKNNHKLSEELLINLFKQKKAKFIVVSFATKTLTRKKMNKPKRKWFELMLKRNNLKFVSFQTNNEIFYVLNIRKTISIRD